MLLLSENTSGLYVFGEGLTILRSVLFFFLWELIRVFWSPSRMTMVCECLTDNAALEQLGPRGFSLFFQYHLAD